MKAGLFRAAVLMLLACVCGSCADVVDETEIMASDMVRHIFRRGKMLRMRQRAL